MASLLNGSRPETIPSSNTKDQSLRDGEAGRRSRLSIKERA